MKKIFEKTAFDNISTIFDDRTCVLFGKNIDSFKGFVSQSAKYNWIIPLGNFLYLKAFLRHGFFKCIR